MAVAKEVFAEQGLEAPLEAIAARAGVGIATLYRRFPTREKLVAAALTEKVAEYAEAAEQALAAADPWDGFAGFVHRICELQAGDRGLSDLLSMSLSADEQVEQLRRTANKRVITLIERAKADGGLRPDFVGEDLVLLLIATAAVMHVTHADAPAPGGDSWPGRSTGSPPGLTGPARAPHDGRDDPGHDSAGRRARLRRPWLTSVSSEKSEDSSCATRLCSAPGSFSAVTWPCTVLQKLFGTFGGPGLEKAGAGSTTSACARASRWRPRPGSPNLAAACSPWRASPTRPGRWPSWGG